MRVELNDLPKDNWQHFIRARDLEQVLGTSSESLKEPVLEIGCGDGYVTTLLRRRFAEVVPMDLRPRGRVDGLCIANAEMLPFRNRCFGMIYSSNVLEHVGDLPASLQEVRRVMRDDAIMIHTMPTPTWKALQLALYPLHLLFHVAFPRVTRRLTGMHLGAKHPAPPQPANPTMGASPHTLDGSKWARYWPQVHGTAESHFEELKHFRVKWWIDQFADNGLEVFRTAPLYLHSAYRFIPYRGLIVREMISRAGLSSVYAYWVKKAT